VLLVLLVLLVLVLVLLLVALVLLLVALTLVIRCLLLCRLRTPSWRAARAYQVFRFFGAGRVSGRRTTRV
jgi:hypothetical protein